MGQGSGLHRLSFGASPDSLRAPLGRIADGIDGIPKLGIGSLIGEIPDDFIQVSIPDTPAEISSKLEIDPLMIDTEAAHAIDKHAIFRICNQGLQVRRSRWTWFDAHVRHS